jgi:hypothetical protein
MRLAPDAAALAQFADALFRHADPGTYISLRAFPDGPNKLPACWIEGYSLGTTLDGLAEAVTRGAGRSASARRPEVFAPPIATFHDPNKATEEALANGLALSVECDSEAQAAKAQLEALLGPATVVVASGGEWLNAETGVLSPKLHLHWRLTEPTRTPEDHATLKRARTLATHLVKADASNKPIVHPMRWPGSIHRKGTPKVVRIVAQTDREIDLADALERLQEAAAVARLTDAPNGPGAPPEGTGEARETAELVRAVLAAEDYHTPLAALAMRFLKGGMPDAQAVTVLRGLMQAVPEAKRDLKDGTALPGRWLLRYDDIPRAISTARAKIGERPAATPGKEQPNGGAWPEPIDFLADCDLTGAPKLQPHHLPAALAPFVFDTAARMGVDPAAVALAAIVTCASVASDDWQVQPKVLDDTWTEAPRLWGAIVGDPSILKTPVIKACTGPVDRMDAAARARHAEAMRSYRAELAALKADKSDAPPPPKPKCDRYMVEGTTTEALSEVLRDDNEANFRAPAGKLLVRQDELSGWLGDMDRYKAGGKGGGDRAAYLTLFNGGRYTIDRIGRGSFAIPNWSACVLGGIQPEPIQRIAKEAADDGLLQRFLYCVPSGQEEGEDRRPDHGALAQYEALFPALAALRPAIAFPGAKASAVVLAEGAHRHRLEIDLLVKAQAAMPDVSTRQKAALGKYRGIFARLALTFHLIEIADANARGINPGPVATVLSEETARRAASYMREILLPHMLRAEALLFLTPQTGHTHWIAGYILASDTARDTCRVTLRDVTRAYGPLRAPERRRELVGCMETLEVMGWLSSEPPENPAKPIAAWQVNPKLHVTFAEYAAIERARRKRAQAEITASMRRFRQENPR